MTITLLEAMTLAEEALRLIIGGGDNEDDEMFYQGLTKGNQALAAIREQKAQQEPVAWMPLAFPVTPNWESTVLSSETPFYCRPLYAAPVRTKDLTDDEIGAIEDKFNFGLPLDIARALIAADREKNK